MNTHYNRHRNKTQRNAPTHQGTLVKRNKEGAIVEQHTVALRECKSTFQDTLFHQYWSKENGRRRPLTAIFPWTLENVQSYDEMLCAQYDKDEAIKHESENV